MRLSNMPAMALLKALIPKDLEATGVSIVIGILGISIYLGDLISIFLCQVTKISALNISSFNFLIMI